ncbi:hypothetical protein BOTBODRAFT_176305 [Botryobasidium botryosum FD-172 SS1]|uniref:Uncharacterized protein n=1 Tax=Botryobasidium botryosum (strain FD-172 SS1) TaxID=930990 RepID=A0A067MM07_BOTB1|nr:hypothetical protein BOTBODRAFT_176305 [Botryobasidium botryosum FD-172 SS1]
MAIFKLQSARSGMRWTTHADQETVETAPAPEETEAEVAGRGMSYNPHWNIPGALYGNGLSGDINLLAISETAVWEARCDMKEAREAEYHGADFGSSNGCPGVDYR